MPRTAQLIKLRKTDLRSLTTISKRGTTIATTAELAREVQAIVKERAAKAIKIEWQFSIETARTKLNRHYEAVQAENVKYKSTYSVFGSHVQSQSAFRPILAGSSS